MTETHAVYAFPKTLTITVTEGDIAKGCRASNRRCPVALAALRAIPDATDIDVTEYDFYVWINGKAENDARYILSPNNILWILSFDKDEPVGPATFRATLA